MQREQAEEMSQGQMVSICEQIYTCYLNGNKSHQMVRPDCLDEVEFRRFEEALLRHAF